MTVRVERGILGMVEKLRAGLPDAVAAINATDLVQADGITVPDIVDVLDYVPPLDDQTAWPLVAVQELPATLGADTGHTQELVLNLLLVCFVHDPDQAVLARLARRVTAAVHAVALQGRTIADPVAAGETVGYGVMARELDPGPMLGAKPDGGDAPEGWVTWRAVVVTYRTEVFD